MADADRLLALAADIERRDREVEAAIERVVALARRTDEIRTRSEQLEAVLETAPRELAVLDRAGAEARAAAVTAADDHAAAERRVTELEAGRRVSAEALAEAVREIERTSELAVEAAARVERLALDHTSLVEATAAASSQVAELALEARGVAAEVQTVPRVSQSGREAPGDDLTQLTEWSSRVHAALFVVRGQLEAERDRLVREANELGATALGEQLAGASVTLVRRRLEEALRP